MEDQEKQKIGKLDGEKECYIRIEFGKGLDHCLDFSVDRKCTDAQLMAAILGLMSSVEKDAASAVIQMLRECIQSYRMSKDEENADTNTDE